MSSATAQASLSRTSQGLNGSKQSHAHSRASPNESTNGHAKPSSKQYTSESKRHAHPASSEPSMPSPASKPSCFEESAIASAWTKRPTIVSPAAKPKNTGCMTSSTMLTPLPASHSVALPLDSPTFNATTVAAAMATTPTTVAPVSAQSVEDKVTLTLANPSNKLGTQATLLPPLPLPLLSSSSPPPPLFSKKYALKPAAPVPATPSATEDVVIKSDNRPDMTGGSSTLVMSHRRGQTISSSTGNSGHSRQSLGHRRHSQSQALLRPMASLSIDSGPPCLSHPSFVQQPYYGLSDEDVVNASMAAPTFSFLPPQPILEDLVDLSSSMSVEAYESELEALLESIRPSVAEQIHQEELFTALKDLIAVHFPTFTLHRFGSTVSGFSLKHADLDFCLFDPDYLASCHETPNLEIKLEAQVKIVVALGELLRKEKRFFNIKVLSRARIPIVKLKDMTTGISCDIGVNNALALHNTRLLATYSAIDCRVAQLALIVKYWAKRRGLNEPYWGTLSSYCYLMMIIYYLQRTEQPILPILQALEKNDTAAQIVEGYDVYFYSDLTRLASVWPYQHVNKASLTSLLSGFFRYFAYDFPYASSVLSVRTGTLLSRDSKGWTIESNSLKAGCFWFCVEDPFELSHNLSRAVSRNSLYYIRGHFIRASKLISRHASIYHICIDASLD